MVEQGYIIWLNFDPQLGHEQKGRRPALVVSNGDLNRPANMIMVCPITKTNRALPFHIKLDSRTKTMGVVMCDQVRAVDVSERNCEFIEVAPADILAEVCDTVCGFMDIR